MIRRRSALLAASAVVSIGLIAAFAGIYAEQGAYGLNVVLRRGAALVVNGSHYDRYGFPDTPVVSDGAALGPGAYEAKQGAFVATSSAVEIRDLAHEDWRTVIGGAENAMVSYPLLIGGKPEDHVVKPTSWLANRSFVGQDRSGRIIIGTTVDAFFPLARFADFLRASPSGLTVALNLDGGPVACQGIAAGGYRRNFCGQRETQIRDGRLGMLTWPYGSWAPPIVLAAIPK